MHPENPSERRGSRLSLLRFLFSELIHSKRFVVLFLINLSLGLSSFIALEFLKTSVDTTVSTQSRNVLGADIGISSRRLITDEELASVESHFPEDRTSTPLIEMFSMVAKGSASSLVQIKAVDHSFPFYGQVVTKPMKKVSDLEDTQTIWVYPEILTLLGARLGDSLKIGNLTFRIAAVVEDDAASGISTSMAPRIYMSLSHLGRTGLLREGTLAWYSRLYKLPTLSDGELEIVRDETYRSLSNPDVQVFTHKNSSEQTARLLNYLGDFLGLVSLSALFIACIGLTFLLSTYLQAKSKSVAILIAIGYSRTQAILFYCLQLLILITVGTLLSAALATLVLPLIMQATQSVATFSIRLTIDFKTLFQSIAIGVTGGLFLLFPHLYRMRDISALQLLRGTHFLKAPSRWRDVSLYFPALALFYFLSVRQMNSFRNGSLFFASFVGTGLVLYLTLHFTLPWIGRWTHFRFYLLEWAIRDITRLRVATVTGFLSLAMGVFLVNVVPQIKANLQAEIARPPESKIPSLFLFDIQSEQVDELKTVLAEEKVPLNNISPLIRARLTAVNGLAFSKGEGAFAKSTTREQERESQFRNRGFNLSYRETLDMSETIVDGRPLPDSYTPDALPEVSLEKRFAERLDLKIGDTLTFDIQETPIQGKITSFRRVNWTSFQPNFFVLFQNGSLEDAPKTYLATIPKIPMEQKLNMQKKILRTMPNISLIDVDRLIQKLVLLIEQMGWALQVMSAFCILVGMTVLLALANDQVRSREWDIGMLKAIGTSYSSITLLFVLQFTLIAVTAAICGGLLSLVGSYIFSYYLFDGSWYFNWKTPLAIFIGVSVFSPILVFLGIRRGLRFSAKDLLSN